MITFSKHPKFILYAYHLEHGNTIIFVTFVTSFPLRHFGSAYITSRSDVDVFTQKFCVLKSCHHLAKEFGIFISHAADPSLAS